LLSSELSHHGLYIDRTGALSSLLSKPKFQQPSDPSKVAIDAHKISHGVEVRYRSNRMIKAGCP
jgi:hypothetical protein